MTEGPAIVRSYVQPASTGGLNYKDSLVDMPPDSAISMLNLIPNGATLDVRRGVSISSCLDMTGSYTANAIGELTGITGTSYIIAATRGSTDYAIHNVTDTPGVRIDTFAATVSGDYPYYRPMFVSYRNILFVLRPGTQKVVAVAPPAATTSDTTDVFTTTDYYGSAMGSYKARIYISSSKTLGVWYTNVDQVSGAMPTGNFYNVSSLLTCGGQISYCGSLTKQAGATSQDLFVIVTTKGEVLVFQGSYPGSESWSIVGRYQIPTPVGSGAYFSIGSSLYVLTESSVISFAELMGDYDTGGDAGKAISARVNNWLPVLTLCAMNPNTVTNISEVKAVYHQKSNRIYIVLPYYTSGTTEATGVLVCDVTTRAWGFLQFSSRFVDLLVRRGDVYATDGLAVYRLEAKDSTDDDYDLVTDAVLSVPFNVTLQTAFNYNSDFSNQKTFTELKAFVYTKDPSSISATLRTDFDLTSLVGTNLQSIPFSGTYGLYQPKFTSGDRNNTGECCSVVINAACNQTNLPMKFAGFKVYYTEGGNL